MGKGGTDTNLQVLEVAVPHNKELQRDHAMWSNEVSPQIQLLQAGHGAQALR